MLQKELRRGIVLSLAGLTIFFSLFSCTSPKKSYDLVIKNGLIVDGTGNPWFRADIGIKNKKVSKIGCIDKNQAERLIDAQDLIVCPGFIDIHTHCDRDIVNVPSADNYIHQGVTTVIGGNCGGHPFPLHKHFEKIKEKGISVNFGCLVGHNTIRQQVMGFKMSAPTEEEMEKMKDLVDQEMKAGAIGFSTGLAYLPGTYSKIDEIVQLASVISGYGGIYASHIRDQGLHITEAIEEAISIGEKNGIPVQISHIKLADEAVWNQLERITRPVEEARKRGVEVTLDQYPYTATSSGFESSFPSWAFEGGREKFQERLKDEKAYEEIKSYIIERRLSSTRGINKLETIYIASSRKFPEFEGKNLEEILISKGQTPTENNAADLMIDIEKNGGASAVFFQMDEKDVENLLRLPYTMHASDGEIEVFGRGVPHPRNYGTFPRVFARYVREKKILPLEEAVRKMTSLPAQTLRLKERGLVKEGMYADITIFDENAFEDKATFAEPHQFSQGLKYVIVNGEPIIENGKYNSRRPGVIIYGRSKNKG
jgi:N-acyl-D-amino-acid deacylase